MTSVALLHSVLGVRQDVLDAAERLRLDEYDVLAVDLFDGRAFDDYGPEIAYAQGDLGHQELLQRADKAVADLSDGFVVPGFSLGYAMAVHAAPQRAVSGVLMIGGAIPPSAPGTGATWPPGVNAQTHSTVDDPWREPELLELKVSEVEAAGAAIEVFDYPGAGHLFTGPTLPAEYDSETTEFF
jgi:dienelactone hydrolase